MKSLINAALEDKPRTLIILCIGVLGFSALKYVVEPWAVETVCRELLRCD